MAIATVRFAARASIAPSGEPVRVLEHPEAVVNHLPLKRITGSNVLNGSTGNDTAAYGYPGAAASILSAISLAVLGKRELNRSAAPVNGPSQWVWGRHAPFKNGLSLKYTVLGYAIHHAVSVFWAMFHEKLQERFKAKNCTAVIAPASAATATAYVVDFHVAPKRLSPGFQHGLTKRAMFIVYGSFAMGLAGVALLRRTDKSLEDLGEALQNQSI